MLGVGAHVKRIWPIRFVHARFEPGSYNRFHKEIGGGFPIVTQPVMLPHDGRERDCCSRGGDDDARCQVFFGLPG